MLWVQKIQANWSDNYFCAVVSETSGEIGWVLTLAIVSILSAAVGAVVMVIILQCRKWVLYFHLIVPVSMYKSQSKQVYIHMTLQIPIYKNMSC